jgi:hypothetical protein
VQLDLEGVRSIQAALLEVPTVVDALDEGGSPAMLAAMSWMRRLETVLASKRLPVTGSVASLRGILVAAKRGRVHDDVEIFGPPNRSKLLVATASLVIERVVTEVRLALSEHEARYSEAARLAQQLLAVAHAKGLSADTDATTIDAVAGWVESASADPDLAGGFTNLVALVGRRESLKLLVACMT